MKKIRFRIIRTFKRAVARFIITYIKFKFWLLKPYYKGLMVQAIYLYVHSDLFKYRWQEMGAKYAEESFKNDIQVVEMFLNKAKKEPFEIRLRIFIDATLGREPGPYLIIK